MKKPPLIVPVEIFTREFEAKILFACAAAERGHDVYVGSKYEIRTAISRFPAGIFVAKSFTSPKARIDRMIRDLGHRIVAWDEEGLVHPDLETYTKRRMSTAALETVEAIFSWGPEYTAFLQSSPRYDGTPVFETGNPRLDLLSEQLRGYHAGRTSQLQETFGRYILINTNFSFVNPDTLDVKGVPSFNLNRKTAHRKSKASPEELAYKGALFSHFVAAAARIARSMPDFTVVIRPHPAESRAPWEALERSHRNIRVVPGGGVVPWLLGAELLVHNGCTTAVESTLLGKPALCYQPIPASVSHWQFPNAVSYVARSEDELVTLAAAHCGGASRLDVTPAQQRVLLHHVTPATSRLCSDRIIDEIDRLGDPRRQIPPGRLIRARVMAHVRTAERLLRQMLPGDIYNKVFQEKRFPATSVADVCDLIGRFAAATGRFRNIEVQPFGKKVFRIRMR